MVHFFGVGLQRRGCDSAQANENSDGKDDNQHGQQNDERQRAEDDAKGDGLPAKLLELKPDGRRAVLPVFDKDVVLPDPDEEWTQSLAERP